MAISMRSMARPGPSIGATMSAQRFIPPRQCALMGQLCLAPVTVICTRSPPTGPCNGVCSREIISTHPLSSLPMASSMSAPLINACMRSMAMVRRSPRPRVGRCSASIQATKAKPSAPMPRRLPLQLNSPPKPSRPAAVSLYQSPRAVLNRLAINGEKMGRPLREQLSPA